MLGLEFEHHAISVFSAFDQFQAINPVVKAPTLVLADGQILMDSTLILDYAAGLAAEGKRLLPPGGPARLYALQQTGLALAACEKTVQIVYEQQLRPQEKRHQPWLDRIQGQLEATYAELEKRLTQEAALPTALGSAEVSVAVAWSFTQLMLPERIAVANTRRWRHLPLTWSNIRRLSPHLRLNRRPASCNAAAARPLAWRTRRWSACG